MDWLTFSLYLAMLGVGWLMVYTVGFGSGYPDNILNLLSTTPVGKQTIWIGLSFMVFFFTQIVHWKFWKTFAYPIYFTAIVLLVMVLFFGATIKGATSWFSLGGFSFQPAELAKFGTALALGTYLSNFNTDLRKQRNQLTAFGLIGLPILLILLQPDAGSALVFLSFLFVLFREGLPTNYYLIGGSVVALLLLGLMYSPAPIFLGLLLIGILIFVMNLPGKRQYWWGGFLALGGMAWWGIVHDEMKMVLTILLVVFLALSVFMWIKKKERLVILLVVGLIISADISYISNYVFHNFLKPHQQERINVWLRPDLCNPRGSLYNVLQSKMAIGSGGLQGKGFLEGTMTKLNYVPEQATDFIFCTIGEEQGFIGSLSIIVLYLILLYRITVIAERQRAAFSRNYAYAVAGIIFVHVFINIGMTIGLMPIIGIPLPFISYGGSSLLGFTLLLGVLLKLDAHRSEP